MKQSRRREGRRQPWEGVHGALSGLQQLGLTQGHQCGLTRPKFCPRILCNQFLQGKEAHVHPQRVRTDSWGNQQLWGWEGGGSPPAAHSGCGSIHARPAPPQSLTADNIVLGSWPESNYC